MSDRYESSFKSGRVTMSSPEKKKSTIKFEDANHILSVKSVEELDQLTLDYAGLLSPADIAILFDVNLDPVKMYTWQNETKDWRMLPDLSVDGAILVEGTTADKGIVQFADLNGVDAFTAVQANDPRLFKEWFAQSAEPSRLDVLWIDTTGTPLMKYHNGTKWTVIAGDKIVSDTELSLITTYSSKKIMEEFDKKSAIGHGHTELTNHLVNKLNPHEVKAAQITDLPAFITNHNDVKGLMQAKHTHPNLDILHSLADSGNELFYKGKFIGRGDMLKSEFDKNSNGIVDQAESLFNGSVAFTVENIKAIENKAHIHANAAILNAIQEPFTTTLKSKLDGVSVSANNYSHPASHGADIINETVDRKWVSPAEKAIWADKYTKAQTDSFIGLRELRSNKGIPGGFASLDPGGTVPLNELPMAFKDTKVAADIAERDVMNKYSGLRVYVANTTGDPAMPDGGSAEYAWDGTKWILLTGYGLNSSSLKFYIDEANNKIIFKVKYGDGVIKTAEVGLA